MYSRSQKKKRNVIMLQKTTEKLQCVLHMCYTELQTVLHKTTDRTTLNYTIQIILQTNYRIAQMFDGIKF